MKVVIGDYDMEKDFHLHLLEVTLGMPEIKTEHIDIPGRNGALDYTEAATGYPTYDNAKHVLKFDFKDGAYQSWINRAGIIKGALHGRRLPVTLGIGTYYYDARISVDTEKINQDYSSIEITLDAAPYRLNSLTSMDDWLWDPFNFETDIAMPATRDIPVPAIVTIYGDAMPAGCIFHCSQAMSVEFNGVTYNLPAGDSSSPDLLLSAGANVFTFSGTGTVSVEYRGGRF